MAAKSTPSNHKQDTCMHENPFANPPTPSTSPAFPSPCVIPPLSATSPRTSEVARWDLRPNKHDPSVAPVQYKPGSMSSMGDSTLLTSISPMELEKTGFAKEQGPKRSRDSKGSHGSRGSNQSRDPEKAMSSRAPSQSSHNNTPNPIAYLEDDEPDEGPRIQEAKALKILFYMSGPCVLLSVLNTAWAGIAIIIAVLSQPIRMCAKRPTFGQQLAGLLGPTLNLQLKCIYTPLPPHANEDASYHTLMLAAVHIFSPILSFVMMFAAWTLAVYWISSKVVGDPAGQDKRDDGRECVLGLRRWWERWLMRSLKEN